MSMSVQSAWDDLVVENPNRAKLEGCLLSTIMLVVCCIIALLVYVFVQLQPQGNVVARAPFWKTNFYDDPPNRQFALRMLGWINWTETRCTGFAQWACGGRAIEASSLAVYETAETAAEDYAAEYALELIQRNLDKHMKGPTEDIGGHGISGNGFVNMAHFLDQCRRGSTNLTDFATALGKLWTAIKSADVPDFGFVQDAKGSTYGGVIETFAKLQFFPLGELYVSTLNDTDSKLSGDAKITTVSPPRLIGTLNDGDSQQFDAVVRAGMQSATSINKLCCGENGKQIVGIEKEMAKWLQDDENVVEFGSPDNIRYDKGGVDICSLFKSTDCRFLDKKFPQAFSKTLSKGVANTQANLINWMWLKFFILLAPLMPLDEPSLAGFFSLVAWYHRRAELPHSDILCMKIIEYYYRDTLDLVLREDAYLQNVAATMKDAVSKVNAALQGGDLTLFTLQLSLLKDKGGAFNAETIKKFSSGIKDFFDAGISRVVYFTPAAKRELNPQDTAEPLDLLKNQIDALAADRVAGKPNWLGPTFRADTTYDPLTDRVYIPIGVAMPPYFHNDTDKIKHAVPGYLPKIFKALLERFIKGFLGQYRPLKANVQRAPEKQVNDLGSKHLLPIGKTVLDAVKCFKKAYGPTMMWDLFYERSAVQLSYQVWRVGYNHATQNKDTQLRLGYIKFISEELIFYITAANGICHTANPNLASKKDIEQAPKRVALVLHSKLLGQSMLCDKRRQLFTVTCPTNIFPEMVQQDEALWTVESWRNAKRVILQ